MPSRRQVLASLLALSGGAALPRAALAVVPAPAGPAASKAAP